tara:strand:- start:1310 stop:3292 length:1983 start_codon:yes stop_codon:yes gene_type:complete
MATVQNIEIRAIDKTRLALANINARVKNLNTGLLGINRVAGLATAALGAIGGTQLIRGIVATTTRFEDLRTTLSSVTGSAQEGAEAFNFITEFSTKTQFGIEELTTSFVKLKAAGIQPTEQLLNVFTNTAAITSDQIGSLEAVTDLFARTVGGGLGLEEIERLGDRGVPVLRILKQELGLNRDQISEFGKSAEGAKLIVDAFAKGIQEEFGDATTNLLSNTNVAFSNLSIAIKQAQDAIGQQGFSKALGDTANQITDLIKNNDELVKTIGDKLLFAFLVTKNAIILVGNNLNFLAKAFLSFVALKLTLSVVSLGLAFGGALVTGIGLALRAIILFQAAMRKGVIGLITAAATGVLLLLETFGKFGADVDELGNGFDELEGEQKSFFETAKDGLTNIVGGYEDFSGAIMDVGRVSNEEFDAIKKDLAETEDTITKVGSAVGPVGTSVKNLGKTYEDATPKVVAFNAAAGRFPEAVLPKAVTLLDTFREKLENVYPNLEAVFVDIADVGMRAFDSLADGLADFVMTGKFSFRDFANAVIKDILRIAAKLAILFAIQTLTGIPVFTAATTRGLAKGGPVRQNETVVVGEAGPELFVPKTAGNVLSNRDSQATLSGAGGGPVTVNFNIVANDTRGFDELLMSRRATIQGIINGALQQKGKMGVI